MKEDIVARLRDHGNELNIPAFIRGDCCEAADEISRLRWQIQGMRDSMDHLEEISKSQRETMTKYLFPQEEQQ